MSKSICPFCNEKAVATYDNQAFCFACHENFTTRCFNCNRPLVHTPPTEEQKATYRGPLAYCNDTCRRVEALLRQLKDFTWKDLGNAPEFGPFRAFIRGISHATTGAKSDFDMVYVPPKDKP